MKRNATLFLCVVVLVAVSACAKEAPPVAPPPPEVTVTEPIPRDVPVSMELVGQAVGFQDVEIRARVEGFLEKTAFTEGSLVKKGGDRPQNPSLAVAVDVIYAHGMGGVKVYKDLYVTGGVRRYALKYNIKLAGYPDFERKPGVWDPLIGIGYHHVGDKLEVHTTFDGGGFGVGADVDIAADFRLDWKPIPHFGLVGGYQVLYLKASDTLVGKTFTFKQTLHGPLVGIGIYF